MAPDINPIDREEAMLAKQMAVAKLIRVHRVRGHLIADLDPLHWKEPHTPRRARPGHVRPDDLGPRPRVPDRRCRRRRQDDARRPARRAARRVLPHDRRRVHAHPEHRRAAWIQEHVERQAAELVKDEKDRVLERLNAAESFEKFLATKYVGTKRFGIEGAESAIPILDEVLSNAADGGLDSVVLGMAHRGRLNVLSNIMGKSYEAIFSEFEGHLDPTRCRARAT